MTVRHDMELFNSHKNAPLAWRMQPKTLAEFIGQKDILGQGRSLREAIEKDAIMSLILYGPPGTGKTSLAHIIANMTGSLFLNLNAVISGLSDIKTALQRASDAKRAILFIDEIHRFNKVQQDALLPDVETGRVILIGASTQNPFFSIIPALSSRSMIYQFFPLEDREIKQLMKRALQDTDRGLGKYGITLTPEAMDFITKYSEGDARRALNALELGGIIIRSTHRNSFDIELAKEVLQKKHLYYNEDEHYNTISAFIKSMRGGDPDAVLYWLAKMLEGGEDPLYIARRIIICASEDVGNADPMALQASVAAMKAVQFIGMPEARIPLAQVALYVALSPKSNASYTGIENALTAVREEKTAQIPSHLKSASYSGAHRLGAGVGYKYPHNYKGSVIAQDYLPHKKRFFYPSEEGFEKVFKKRLQKRRTL
jgi:putative ATPase